jgi:2-polyprenyl-3-methyl-5-hydroxy-6-metoxy-1,4-benzoquinol methylase
VEYLYFIEDSRLSEYRGREDVDLNKRDFDKEAATWETPPRVKLASDVAGAMLKQVRLSRDMDVLDFGCGTGLIALQFAPHVRSVTGVDTSRGMLDVFQHKAQCMSLDNIRLSHLKTEDGGSIAGQYHLITSSMTLHHVQDTQKLLKQFHQALLPGGQIAIADLDEEGGRFHDNNDGVFHFGFDREKLRRLFVEAGFSDVCSTTAGQMNKPGPDGRNRVFSLFLITGRKRPVN